MRKDKALWTGLVTALALAASGGLPTAAVAGAPRLLTKEFPLGTQTLCCSARARPPHSPSAHRSAAPRSTSTTRSAGGSRTGRGSRAATSAAAPGHHGGVPESVDVGVPPLLAILVILGQVAAARWRKGRRPAAAPPLESG